MHYILEAELNGKILKIYHDENASSPREDDNLTTMACFHARYSLGDKGHKYVTEDYHDWEEFKADLIKKEKPILILPLYMYDHSGITISLDPFGDKWDSGQIGFVFITNKSIDNIGTTINDGENFTDYRKRLATYMRGEVETYDLYLRGECYGYEIIHEDGTEDSCGGFLGTDWVNNGVLGYVNDPELVAALK